MKDPLAGLDEWITGHYGEDAIRDEVEPDEDEPANFNERRASES